MIEGKLKISTNARVRRVIVGSPEGAKDRKFTEPEKGGRYGKNVCVCKGEKERESTSEKERKGEGETGRDRNVA